jgi:hypothetical protein
VILAEPVLQAVAACLAASCNRSGRLERAPWQPSQTKGRKSTIWQLDTPHLALPLRSDFNNADNVARALAPNKIPGVFHRKL